MKKISLSDNSSFKIEKISKFLLVIVFAFSFTIAQAKKMNYSFEVMVGMADVIVTGQIASVSGDSSYLFNISETIKGKTNQQIKVKMFRNWTCDMRWKKAATGQKLFLCLTKNNGGYDIMGGSDGEIFIIDNKLRLFNIFNAGISQYFNEANSPKLNDVIISIKNFISCYSFTDTNASPLTFKQIKRDDEVLRLKNMNKFSVWLFDMVTDRVGYYKIIKAS